jgi:hypothetical protein
MTNDEAETKVLLGQLRVQPSAQARARAIAAVAAEFHAAASPASAEPSPRLWGIAAAAALAAVCVWTWTSMQPGATVAKLESLDGILTERGAHWFSTQSTPKEGESLAAGASLTVSNDGGALLRISPVLSVRLAAGTHATLTAADQIRLDSGTAFVDARPGERAPLRILTPHGEVTHLGTQYLVRSDAREIEVAVREGRAQLTSSTGVKVASAGEWLLQRDGAHDVKTGTLEVSDKRFDWLGNLPSNFHLEGATLGQFLAWFHRETGLLPIYSTGVDTGTFAHVQLKGSIDDLDPVEALSYVLATADLAWHREGSTVIIEQRPVPRT